jgi:acyl carrier protein
LLRQGLVEQNQMADRGNRRRAAGRLAKSPVLFYAPLRHVNERNANLGPATDRTLDEMKRELKRLLVEYLAIDTMKPEDIGDDQNLFGEGGVGLDSLDGVEIVVLLHRHYGLDVKSMQKSRDVFRSIDTLAPYVLAHATK